MLNSEYSPDWYVDLHTVSFIVTHEVYKGGGGGKEVGVTGITGPPYSLRP